MGTPMTYISGNTGTYQSGTFNKGSIALNLNPTSLASGNNWYNGVDVTATQYLIYSDTYSQGQATVANSKPTAWTTPDLSDTSLLNLINTLPDRVGVLPFTSLPLALQWLNATNKYFLIKTNFENIVTSGLVLNLDAGWYNSYSGTTTWFDRSGNGNNGTLTNGPTFNSSSQGTIVFDGGDDYISFNNISPISSLTFTISSVVTVDTDTVQYMRVVSKGHYGFTPGYLLQRFGDSGVATGIRFSLGIGSSTSNASTSLFAYTTDTFQKGQKYYLTMVSTGTYLYLYVNGVRVGLTKYSGTGGSIENGTDLNYSAISASLSITTSDKFTIGAYSNTSNPVGEYWNGKISNTLIYNTALSPEQVLQNYNAQKSRFGIYDFVQSGLTYSYDAGNYLSFPRSGTTWSNMSNGSNNGTLTNGPVWSSNSGGTITFDGSDDYVAAGSGKTLNNMTVQMSVSVLSNAGGYKGFAGAVGSGNDFDSGFNIDMQGGSTASFSQCSIEGGFLRVGGGTNFMTSSVPFGQWKNICFTISPTYIQFYLDGIKQFGTNRLNNASSTIGMNSLVIGARPYSLPNTSINANIRDVIIYDRALGDSEVVQNFEASRKNNVGLTGYTTSGLTLNMDAGNYASYPTTGTKWVDISGNYNNGTLTNGPVWSNSSGGTFTFDGVDDYVTIPSFSLPVGSFSCEAFFQWASLGSDKGSIFSLNYNYPNSGYLIRQKDDSSGKFVIWSDYGSESGIFSTAALTVNTWNHVVVVQSAGTCLIYINGVLDSSQSLPNPVLNQSYPILFGTRALTGSVGAFLSGKIGISKIYNRVLSATEVSQNYNALKGRFGL